MTKSVPPSASPRSPRAPERLVEFLTEKLPHAASITLAQRTTAAHQVVDSWTIAGKERPEVLASQIWARAIEDVGSQPHVASPHYAVLVRPKNGGEDGARLPLTVPVPREASGPLSVYPADQGGAIAQTMQHLQTREAASHAMLIEGLDSIVGGVRGERDEHQRTRAADSESFKSVVAAYEKLIAQLTSSYTAQLEAAQETIANLSTAYNAQALKTLELIPTIEELHSQRHERELATAKQARSDARKDRVVDQAASLLFPFIAKKIVPALGPASPPPPPPDAPPTTTTTTPTAPSSSPSQFGPRALRAIENFLGAITEPDALAIRAALRPELATLFDQLAESLYLEAQDRSADTGRPTTNGVRTEATPS